MSVTGLHLESFLMNTFKDDFDENLRLKNLLPEPKVSKILEASILQNVNFCDILLPFILKTPSTVTLVHLMCSIYEINHIGTADVDECEE